MRSTIFVAGLVVMTLALAPACVDGGRVNLGADCELGFCDEVPGFTPLDAGDTGAPAPSEVLACIGTECPAPYATCEPSQRCAVNLMRDPNHCGACGVTCRGIEDLNLAASCVNGTCAYQCEFTTVGKVYRDCNSMLDDGCETNIWSDPKNCGSCGHACADGDRCVEGFCGCFAPLAACGDQCVDLRGDDDNCGSCGKVCSPPADGCNPTPSHAKYGCVDSQCGQLECERNYGDCNEDMSDGCTSDGCETDITTTENCGACGVRCDPDQECRRVGVHRECKDRCEKTGRVSCDGECVDLTSDPKHCGGCAFGCLGARQNQVSTCRMGLCGVSCLEGFADCNDDPSDGCEVDLLHHAGHCGACGVECDIGLGQPCIEGKCLMVACDGGVVAK